ncbi:prepilin-type N-terminal cleavage/methylation domain-containing protein [Neobacillus sp. LXY-4]|uniref:prepilin-type N-terminal cleavage/methylation domain-containing protein n=1 Tax=Neobacillus sp. LXY-4 TaxID=3379826 RepID=UPI003EE36FC9
MEKTVTLLKKNEKGLTLLELLITLALVSMVLLMATSVHLFGQKQMNSQSNEVQNQSNVRLALNIVTKEIRKASSVSVANNVLTINGTDVYKLENNILKKNNQTLISNIQQFTITKTDEKLTVKIANTPSNNHPQTTLSTTIYLRK